MIHRRIWRKAIGVTLKQIAAEMKISPAMIQYWEVGKQKPSAEQNARWVKILSLFEAASRRRVDEARRKG